MGPGPHHLQRVKRVRCGVPSDEREVADPLRIEAGHRGIDTAGIISIWAIDCIQARARPSKARLALPNARLADGELMLLGPPRSRGQVLNEA